MTAYTSTLDTAAGPFTIIVDADGGVLASGWTADAGVLVPLIHRQLREEPIARRDVGPAASAVRAYHDGDLTAPDTVPVHQHATGGFLPAAWKTLREVRAGEPVSYSELAARTGNSAAVRAAAQACARNAAALFVPCHRVIRTDGGLGGFRWGLDVKRWLLDHEAKA